MTIDPLIRLHDVLCELPNLTVAVSGGVDSLTLAFTAARVVPGFSALHAVSPSVPPAATQRVKDYALRHNWPLKLIESGEFNDERYRANPHDRCYFCKSNLYATMAARSSGPLASGTNLDDLGDYRPGLIAAKEHGVRHPFVEAGIDKATLRQIAVQFGLADIAALPAQPCLASRIMTGLRIAPEDLEFVDKVEALLRDHVPGDLRCRVTADGVVIEADHLPTTATALAAAQCQKAGRIFLGHKPYQRGSAFVLPDTLEADQHHG
ncbi:uncharacterized protein SAMN04488030_0131 [Aliiroseovarius halocynthiae]|uniref:Adenine nucleotide alpha hydrolase n=1 Tax=Aliiroseovarius halocynthiae TaxID=985055 RepID=A0A545SLL1_9RHOB|nr:adenine nucleotide alpha hydrolase [Aliiroseovarius halocynthiae]TQV65726.1 adenine nucleotide alpha hydrolase [Aliiroseovarius halocynthiae]SMR83981.1 uncharacterized protein SAMN04488030_0131 [Aliiroseovarius halocynthiae]